MTFFLSAEVDGSLSEAIRQARNRFSKAVIQRLARDYGSDIEIWSLITILRHCIPEGWGEVYKYNRHDREAEFRLIIDYKKFQVASAEEQVQMLIKSILRSVDLFHLLKVKDFDIDRFRRDIVDAVRLEGWSVSAEGCG